MVVLAFSFDVVPPTRQLLGLAAASLITRGLD